MMGEVGILNVGAGDTKLSFDPKKPAEVKRSAKIVKDMIRRGFIVLIEIGKDEKGPIYRRALDFDESVAEYIIAGDPIPSTASEKENDSHDQKPAGSTKGKRKASKARTSRTRVAASRTNAVAVARTAGG